MEKQEEVEKTSGSKIMEQGERKGYKYLVVQNSSLTDNWHNGYVKIADSKEKIDVKTANVFGKELDVTYDKLNTVIETVELTFCGEMSNGPDGYWIGFDTLHIWNEKNPETKSHKSVRRKTFELIDELDSKNVLQEKDVMKNV